MDFNAGLGDTLLLWTCSLDDRRMVSWNRCPEHSFIDPETMDNWVGRWLWQSVSFSGFESRTSSIPTNALTAWPNYHWIPYSATSKVIGYTWVCLYLNSKSKFLALNLTITAFSTSCIYPLDIIWKLCLSKTLLSRFCDQKCLEFQIPREWKIECWLLLIGSMWKF